MERPTDRPNKCLCAGGAARNDVVKLVIEFFLIGGFIQSKAAVDRSENDSWKKKKKRLSGGQRRSKGRRLRCLYNLRIWTPLLPPPPPRTLTLCAYEGECSAANAKRRDGPRTNRKCARGRTKKYHTLSVLSKKSAAASF